MAQYPVIILSESLGIPQSEMDTLLDSAAAKFGDKQCTVDEVIRFLLNRHGLISCDAPKSAAIGYMAALEKLRSMRTTIPASALGIEGPGALVIEGQAIVDWMEEA